MDIGQFFNAKASQLYWQPLDASHVSGLPAPQSFTAGQSYFEIRLIEMYLASARKLWRELYPMLHSYIDYGAFEQNSIAGPGQLPQLGDTNLDRVGSLNQLLMGPIPFDGEEITLLAGLYAMPGHDAVKALIDALSALASFSPGIYAQTLPLASIVTTGIESLLGLDQATLQLGVRDSFSDGLQPFTSGYFMAIGAPAANVDPAQLWLVNGRLLKGSNAISAAPYSDHDYMVIAIERIDARDDWQSLPEIAAFLPKFTNVMGDELFSVDEKRARLAALWSPFLQVLDDSPNLTDPDRARIAALIGDRWVQRLAAQETENPFLK